MNTPPYAPSYPPPVPARTAPETMPPLPRASKGRVMRQGARRFFRGIRDLVRMIFDGRPIIAACLVLLLPLAGWLAYDRIFAPASSSGPQVVTQLPEQPVVQQYLKAVQKGDVDAAWNALSASEKAQRIARNEDKTVFAKILQYEQQSKMAYTAIHYVGSHQDGATSVGAYYFYVGEVGNGKQTKSLPLIFAVDRNGTISEIADGLYDAVRAQMQGP